MLTDFFTSMFVSLKKVICSSFTSERGREREKEEEGCTTQK